MSARAAYRVAPRRQQAARGSRIDWDRLGRVALVIVFVLVLAWYISPTINFLDAIRDSHAEGTQLQQLKHENQALKKEQARLNRPDAAERAARRVGMVAPGEQPYVVRGLNH